MLKKHLRSITKLLGLMAILALGGTQQPASAAVPSTCGGVPGCWVCTAEDEDGNFCLVWYCDGEIDYMCW